MDNANFRDARGLNCKSWLRFKCEANLYSEYSTEMINAVRTNCPVSCDLCEKVNSGEMKQWTQIKKPQRNVVEKPKPYECNDN